MRISPVSNSMARNLAPIAQAEEAPAEPQEAMTITINKSAVGKAVRAVPGTISTVLHSPWTLFTPAVCAVSSPSNQKQMADRELFGAGIFGGVAGGLGAYLTGFSGWGTVGIAAAGLVGLGVLTYAVQEMNGTMPFMTDVVDARQNALDKVDSEDASIKAGVAFRAGAAAGFNQSYERGATLIDGTVASVESFGRFLKGTTMKVD